MIIAARNFTGIWTVILIASTYSIYAVFTVWILLQAVNEPCSFTSKLMAVSKYLRYSNYLKPCSPILHSLKIDLDYCSGSHFKPVFPKPLSAQIKA